MMLYLNSIFCLMENSEFTYLIESILWYWRTQQNCWYFALNAVDYDFLKKTIFTTQKKDTQIAKLLRRTKLLIQSFSEKIANQFQLSDASAMSSMIFVSETLNEVCLRLHFITQLVISFNVNRRIIYSLNRFMISVFVLNCKGNTQKAKTSHWNSNCQGKGEMCELHFMLNARKKYKKLSIEKKKHSKYKLQVFSLLTSQSQLKRVGASNSVFNSRQTLLLSCLYTITLFFWVSPKIIFKIC